MKNIRKLPGAGGYVIRWRPHGAAGSYRQETMRGATFEEAKRELHRLHAVRPSRSSFRRVRVRDLWTRYAAVQLPKLAPGWRSRVAGFFERLLLPRFGDFFADDLTPQHLVRYRHDRECDHLNGDSRRPLVSASTIDREVSGLLALLNFAVTEGLIERNPIPPRALRKGRRPPASRNFFEPSEWQAFVRAFEDEKAWAAHMRKVRRLGPMIVNPETNSERRHGGGRLPDSKASHEHRARLAAAMPLFRWLLVSGSRVGEGIALLWESVDLRRGFVTIYQEKTKRAKTLPLSAEARRLLEAQPRGLPGALVLPRPSGGPWEHAKLWRTFKFALRLSGGRGELRIHDLRHTAGSWLGQAGFSEAVISEVLGHSRAGVTAGYVHLRPEHLREAVEKLGELARTDLRTLAAETRISLPV